MNGPNIPQAPSLAPQPGTDKQISHTEGTVEEQGGKKDSGKPSGLDKGALEINGEAGGTNSSPGPTAEEVRRFHEQHQSVKEKMTPHLQLMWVISTTPLISGAALC
jgi:hypothetical protein